MSAPGFTRSAGNERPRPVGAPYARACVDEETLNYSVICPACGHLSTIRFGSQAGIPDTPKAAAQLHGEHWVDHHVQSVRLRLPATFVGDHLNRFADTDEFGAYEIERSTKTTVTVWFTPFQVRNLVGDARYYVGLPAGDVDDWFLRSLVGSARSTLASLERQGVTL